MEEGHGEITICYGDQSISLDRDDLKADLLVEALDLPYTPLTMFSIDPNTGQKKVIPLQKKDKFQVGRVYHIQKKAGDSTLPLSMYGGLSSAEIEANPLISPDQPWHWQPLREVVQNAVVLSKAVYAANDLEIDNYLQDNLDAHNFEKIVRSHHGRSHFVIGEESDENRLYIALRGSHTNEDWHDNLHAYQEPASKGMRCMEGRVHSGFLKRAKDFPLQKILNDDQFRSMNLIFCGHSLGGAVATLAAIMAMIELKALLSTTEVRWVKCITFGAPMVGDENFRQFCRSHHLDRHIYNFVNEEDPIPRILSYSQVLSAMSSQLENDIRNLTSACSTSEAENYYKEKRQQWVNQKDKYMEILGKIIPILEPALELTSLALPKYGGALVMAKGLAKIVQDVMASAKTGELKGRNVYTYMGNYMIVSKNDCTTSRSAQYCQGSRIDDLMELPLKQSLSQSVQGMPNFHAIDSYEDIIGHWSQCAGRFPTSKPHTVMALDQAMVEYIRRRIHLADPFKPHIETAELVRVNAHGKDHLRLRLTGRHLFEFVIEKCSFNFGFPFATSPERFTCKKVVQTDGNETLIIEEEFHHDPNISDLGTLIKFVSKFGECEYLLRISQIRNVKIPTLNETLSEHESLAILVKRAIQRGMAVAHLTRIHRPGKNSWKPINEKIIKEVERLGTIALSASDNEALSDVFQNTDSRNQFILSNEQEFNKIERICKGIQAFLKSPLKLTAEKTVLMKIGIGVAALLGGVTFGYALGPGIVLIGMMEATSMSVAGLAGSLGFLSTGFMTNYFFTSSPVDENYEIVLIWLTMELMKMCQKQANETEDPKKLQLIQEVTDLRESGSLSNLEKALLLMYDPELGTNNFVGCDVENCTFDSQLLVIKRIECIQAIHSIRSLMAEQCYIGIVGMQDAGKTTLINKIWGVGGRTGNFSHTMVPVIYEVHEKVSVVDFPGSTSLDYHAKTFSICGVMNNLILVIVPYTGDMNKLIAREIGDVFSIMAGSESSQVLLCINKSGYELPKALKEEMNELKNPLVNLKSQFASMLNQYFVSAGSSFKVSEENILFTDWMVGDTPEMKELGIIGVDGIKSEIRKYLIRRNIFGENNVDDLETCFFKN